MEVNILRKTAFDEIVNGAGVLLTEFNPSNPVIDDTKILFATTGGINATAVPAFKDYGEGMDNAMKNALELKQITDWECKLSGDATTITTSAMSKLGGASDVVDNIVKLRKNLKSEDFSDIWWVGEKTKENTVTYIKLSNALSTGGIAIQTTDEEKGKFSFEFTGHFSIENQDEVPFEYGEITVI